MLARRAWATGGAGLRAWATGGAGLREHVTGVKRGGRAGVAATLECAGTRKSYNFIDRRRVQC
jgi:hypothetical protein